ncbi:MAG: DUF58 domain-containing protein [bacterium]|nr:DUF58 domain-containing protein [bacterium]MCP5071604.1 DUF58 domain-containing protein [bacterium]
MAAPGAQTASGLAVESSELSRAARTLLVRSQREVTGAFVGGYQSAFRGVGIEFEESRPYVPGDDVRFLDASVMARTGMPYVKRFREERNQTVHLVIDVSGSMAFGSTGRSKGLLAAHTAALISVAALRAGDRVGLWTFDDGIRDELPPARGGRQARKILERLVAAPAQLGGQTGLADSLARVRSAARRRGLVFVLSDFRDEHFFAPATEGESSPRTEWIALARRHDLSAILIHDPREDVLPRSGTIRIADPERPGRTQFLATGRQKVRRRYRAASEVRRRALVRRLRGDGASVLTLRTDREPLRGLVRFFAERSATGGRGRR